MRALRRLQSLGKRVLDSPGGGPWAIEFNGASTIFDAGNDATVNNLHGSDFTAEAWACIGPNQALTNYNDIISKRGGGNTGWSLYWRNNQFTFQSYYSVTSISLVVAYVPDGQFHHYALTYTGTGDRKVRLWVDGALAGTSAASAGDPVSDATQKLTVGGRNGLVRSNALYGAVGWVRVSNSVRYAAPFTPAARSAPPAGDANTVRLFKANEGGGATIIDHSPNGLNVTLVRGTWIKAFANDGIYIHYPTPAAAGEFIIAHWTDIHQMGAIPDWIAKVLQDQFATKGIEMVLVTGDVGPVGIGIPAHWALVNTTFNFLTSAPYLVTMGNHDYDDQAATRAATAFDGVFTQARYTGLAWWAGGFAEVGDAHNLYHIATIDGQAWIFICLEFGPRQAIIDWANALLTTHADKNAVIATHSYMYHDGTRTGVGDAYNPHTYGITGDAHDGEEMWTELIKGHDNIKMVISGHDLGGYPTHSVIAQRTDNTDGGEPVYQSLANWQELGTTLNHYLHFIYINSTTGAINRIETYSPYFNTPDTDILWVDI